MTRRLWFDLPATLRLSEHALSRPRLDRRLFGAPTTPSLLLTTLPRPRLASIGLPALLVGNSIRPEHLDVVSPHPGWPIRHQYLPLAEPGPLTGTPLRDLLRDGARNGHCWFTLDITHAGHLTLRTRPFRDTDTLPPSTGWVDATVRTDRLGPYAAQVAYGYRTAGTHIARFNRMSVELLAAATQSLPPGPGGQITVRTAGDEVHLIHHGAGGQWREEPVAREPGGWYRINHPALPWTATTPPERQSPGPEPIFEPSGPEGQSLRCTVCGAINEIDHQELPSMAGHGYDTSTRCTLCGSTESTDPIFGLHTHPAVWPPTTLPQGPTQ